MINKDNNINNEDNIQIIETTKNQLIKSDLKTRIISSIVMIAITVITFLLGKPFASGLFIICGILMMWEWDRMFNKTEKILNIPVSIFFIINIVILGLSSTTFFITKDFLISVCIIIAGFIVSMFTAISKNKTRFIFESISTIYIGIPILSALCIYNNYNIFVLIFIFVITTSTDICAYFVGRYFKGKKLAPKISPGKTISGAIGGVIGSFIFSGIYIILLFIYSKVDVITSLYLFSVLSIVLSIIAQAGDLFESYCKRTVGVKDSSNIIKGHGGFLDRFDSFLAIAPIYTILLAITPYVM